MRRLFRYMDVVHKKVTKQDWDNVWVIEGYEGTGKSNIGLHCKHKWDTLLYGNCVPKAIDLVALDKSDFAMALKDVKKYEMLIYDEAGELSNLRQMDKFNHLITQAYQVIRGDNLFTILILPSVFDLNPFFTARRARGLITVYKRGSFAFYDRKRLQKIVHLNRNRKVKTTKIVPPLFRDTFPKYEGVLLEPYNQKKQAKMALARKKLYDELVEDQEDRELALLKRAKDKLGVDTAADLFGIARRTVYSRLEKMQDASVQ